MEEEEEGEGGGRYHAPTNVWTGETESLRKERVDIRQPSLPLPRFPRSFAHSSPSFPAGNDLTILSRAFVARTHPRGGGIRALRYAFCRVPNPQTTPNATPPLFPHQSLSLSPPNRRTTPWS